MKTERMTILRMNAPCRPDREEPVAATQHCTTTDERKAERRQLSLARNPFGENYVRGHVVLAIGTALGLGLLGCLPHFCPA
jgi:hypothetical protein